MKDDLDRLDSASPRPAPPSVLGVFLWPSDPPEGSDNDGRLDVSAYRGIGSETVRRPVVIAGRDPDKAMAGMSAPRGKPQLKLLKPRL